MLLPILYAKSSSGKIKQWQIWVMKQGPTIYTRYGYVGGAMQEDRVVIRKGKNIGKKNETSPYEQALRDEKSKWDKKKLKKYVEDPSGESDILLPMLAHSFDKRGHHIQWPAMVQPKLNGVRCLARKVNGEIKLTSRLGQPYILLDHITKYLKRVMKEGMILDGELFSHALTFQEICSAVKQKKTVSPNAEKVEYWVYDMVTDAPFWERYETYSKLLEVDEGKPVFPVPSVDISEEKYLQKLHELYLALKYEGSIIRNREGLYKQDFRSQDLQKYKDFMDDEFMIIGASEGKGRAEGTVIWRCSISNTDKVFDVRPKGTEKMRRLWWKYKDGHIGKMLTVRYQNLSDDGIPIFPVGLGIRDYE